MGLETLHGLSTGLQCSLKRSLGTLRSNDATAMRTSLKSEFAFFQSLSQSKVPIFSIDAIATLHPSVPVPALVLEHFVTSYA